MDIRTEKREEVTIVSVKGRMDAVASPEFDRELNDRMAGGEKTFIIDFAELDYISSAGLRSILAAAKRLKEHGGQLSLASLKEVVREVFDISGFSSIIPIYESVESASAEIS